MFKYFHIIKFLMTHDLTFLKECWGVEFIKGKFSWRKIFTRIIKNENRNYYFYFWWRLANEMFTKGTKKQKKVAKKIQFKLVQKYNTEIQLGAKIDKGLNIIHFMGIEITDKATIGKNFTCLQMTSIAFNFKEIENCKINIGDNVYLGCGSVILGGEISIGNNVKIGAMSFINKDIPDNCTVYTEKTNTLKIKAH